MSTFQLANDLVIWNSSSSHYKVAPQTLEESACGECRCERPADRAHGAECAGASVLGEASPSSPCSPAGRITMSTSRRLPHHGSIKSNAGSLNSPENKSSEAFTPPSGSSSPTSVPSSTCTTKTQSPSNGPSPLTRFWLQSNASVTKLSRLYVANFRFT